ncbi:MAG: phosphoglycerate kinase [Chloroflexota bacterium]|nr:phosphoglycerate kinase [Chloroflexota bacterium]
MAGAFRKRTIRDVDPRGKRVLVRVDLNVPLADGRVADDTRIRAVIPTIQYLRDRGAMLGLCSHLGRPKGVDPKYSLTPVAQRLTELLESTVRLLPECVGPAVKGEVLAMSEADVLLLENTRFHPEEEKNDPAFAKQLADGFDLYVNDAFAAAHRAHASTEGVAHVLPAYAGFLLERELEALGSLLAEPARPFLAIVGGAKVSTKIDVLRSLASRVDGLAVGGGMANTFLSASGVAVGTSLREADKEGEARDVIETLTKRGGEIVLPTDVVCAPSADDAGAAVASAHDVSDVPADQMIVDVGPKTIDLYARTIGRAKTIFWNGPVGVFEVPRFALGTRRVAELLARSGATTVVGGGESVQAVEELGLASKLTHVSTGGGASLELIEGKTLPGVAAIPDR